MPQRDPGALAQALRRVLTEDGLADRMASTSRLLAESQLWPSIAAHYIALGRSLVAASTASVA